MNTRFFSLCILSFAVFTSSLFSLRAESGRYEFKKNISVGFSPYSLVIPLVEVPIGIHLVEPLRLNITPTYMSSFYGDAFSAHIFGATASASFFIENGRGWYLEPGFVFLHGRGGGDSVNLIGGQFIGGYEAVWKSGFFMNFGLGMGVGKAFYDNEDELLDIGAPFPYPTANATIGLRFGL